MTKPAKSWALLLEAFHASLSWQNLAFATAGTFAMVLVWAALGYVVPASGSADEKERDRVLSSFTLSESTPSTLNQPDNQIVSLLPEPWRQTIAGRSAIDRPIDPIDAVCVRLVDPVRQLFLTGNSWGRIVYLLVGSLGTIAIWSFFGLAITRQTVLRCSGHKAIDFLTAIQFAGRRCFDVFSAVTLPLLGMALMGIPAVALGWIMHWEVGFLVAGVAWIAVVLVGCLMSVLGLGLLAGWPLMWGAISSENSDAFDAISRSYAYVFQRPVRFVLYVLIAMLLGKFGWLVAWTFSTMVISFSYWVVEMGCGTSQIELLQSLVSESGKPDGTSNVLWIGATMVRQVIRLVHCVASAYSFSFLWSAAAAIYLLLRRDTDQTDTDDVFVNLPTTAAE